MFTRDDGDPAKKATALYKKLMSDAAKVRGLDETIEQAFTRWVEMEGQGKKDHAEYKEAMRAARAAMAVAHVHKSSSALDRLSAMAAELRKAFRKLTKEQAMDQMELSSPDAAISEAKARIAAAKSAERRAAEAAKAARLAWLLPGCEARAKLSDLKCANRELVLQERREARGF